MLMDSLKIGRPYTYHDLLLHLVRFCKYKINARDIRWPQFLIDSGEISFGIVSLSSNVCREVLVPRVHRAGAALGLISFVISTVSRNWIIVVIGDAAGTGEIRRFLE